MSKFTCVYSRKAFDQATKEHVLQSFLGANWISSNIVCNAVQVEFGKTIDRELEERLRSYRNLLGTLSSRGSRGLSLRKEVNTADGSDIELLPGGQPRLARPLIKVKREEKNINVSLRLGSKSQEGWAAAVLRQRIPEMADVITDKYLSGQSYQSKYERVPPLGVNASLGGKEYFRAILKSCFNLLAVNDTESALHRCFDPLREFVLTGDGEPGPFIRWLRALPEKELPRLGSADHAIAFLNRGRSIGGIVKLFGVFFHVFRLTDDYEGPELRCSYAVDPFREAQPAEQRGFSFVNEAIPNFEDCDSFPSDESIQFCKECLCSFERVRQERDFVRIYDKVASRFLQKHGDELTEELKKRLVFEVIEAWRKAKASNKRFDTDEASPR